MERRELYYKKIFKRSRRNCNLGDFQKYICIKNYCLYVLLTKLNWGKKPIIKFEYLDKEKKTQIYIKIILKIYLKKNKLKTFRLKIKMNNKTFLVKKITEKLHQNLYI